MTEQHHDPHHDPQPDPQDEGRGAGPAGGTAEPPPETGDLVIDAALRDLASAPADDLDAQLESGEAVHRTLQSRLGDLGG